MNTVTKSTRTIFWPGKGEVEITTYRCSSCACAVGENHIPDSSECDENYQMKMESQRD